MRYQDSSGACALIATMRSFACGAFKAVVKWEAIGGGGRGGEKTRQPGYITRGTDNREGATLPTGEPFQERKEPLSVCLCFRQLYSYSPFFLSPSSCNQINLRPRLSAQAVLHSSDTQRDDETN